MDSNDNCFQELPNDSVMSLAKGKVHLKYRYKADGKGLVLVQLSHDRISIHLEREKEGLD